MIFRLSVFQILKRSILRSQRMFLTELNPSFALSFDIFYPCNPCLCFRRPYQPIQWNYLQQKFSLIILSGPNGLEIRKISLLSIQILDCVFNVTNWVPAYYGCFHCLIGSRSCTRVCSFCFIHPSFQVVANLHICYPVYFYFILWLSTLCRWLSLNISSSFFNSITWIFQHSLCGFENWRYSKICFTSDRYSPHFISERQCTQEITHTKKLIMNF